MAQSFAPRVSAPLEREFGRQWREALPVRNVSINTEHW